MKFQNKLLMSEADNGEEGGSGGTNSKPIGEQDFKHFQSDMDKKLGGVNQQVQALIQSQQALIHQLTPKTPAEDEALDSLGQQLFVDPDKALKKLTDKIKNEVRGEIASQNQAQSKTNQTIQQLAQEYPELQDLNSDLTKEAIKIFDGYNEAERNNPVFHKAAVLEAAQSLGIPPKSKRKSQNNDDFSLSGNNSRSGGERPAKLAPETIEFARIMGLNTNDKEVVKRLSEHAKRDFGTWR